MRYREYSPDDYLKLKKLLAELQDIFVQIDDEYRELDDADIQRYLDKIIDDAEKMDGKIFLALEKDKVIGFVQGVIIERNDFQHRPSREGWVGLLFVEKHFREHGIGDALMMQICDYFRTKNCDYVKLFCGSKNTNAIKFYQKCGFEISNLELKLNLTI